MSRRAVWLQLLLGWVPMWALFTMIIVFVHADTSLHEAIFIALRSIIGAVILGFAVQRFTERLPWPTPVTATFVLAHIAAAIVYSLGWFILNSVIQSILHGGLVIALGVGIAPFLATGVWLYVMIAGVSYTLQSNVRAATAESAAARAQLSALRGQLNPHFLFNALHTVVQLIPQDPQNASHAAQQVAALLRATLEEDRDIISLGRELDFVERYLDVEKIRYGERLRVHVQVDAAARESTIPSFAIQTLVENAVRHGAQPQIEPTDVTIRADNRDSQLRIVVADTGAGYNPANENKGTGLRRLRDRLSALYGARASLDVSRDANGGTIASLVIPQGDGD
jgi:LytS/YehU family sensor histidine kinase